MTMTEIARHALKDMVELEMYLIAQPGQRPWHMVPRRVRAIPAVREPYNNPIEFNAANELITLGFIEYTSTVTLVVSKSGRDFYEREIKATISFTHSGTMGHRTGEVDVGALQQPTFTKEKTNAAGGCLICDD